MAERQDVFFFAGPADRRLYGCLHHSPRPAATAVLYCQPFAEEQNQSHAVVARALRAMAAAGLPAMRFDFSGCGDSEGDLEEASLSDWIAEIGAAASHLKRETGAARVGVWGLRLGAWLALAHAARVPETPFAALWQPVMDPLDYLSQFLRQSLASALAAGAGKLPTVKGLSARIEGGETVEVMGYPMARRLHRSFQEASSLKPFAETRCPLLLLAVGEGDEPPARMRKEADAQQAAGRDVTLRFLREEPFWDRYWRWECPAAAEATAEWALSRSRPS